MCEAFLPIDRIVRTDRGNSCGFAERGGHVIIYQMREQNKRVTPCLESTGPARRGSRRFITRFIECATIRIFGSLHLISIAYTTSNADNTVSYLVFITGLPQYTYGLDLAHGVRIIVLAFIYIYIYIYLFIYLLTNV
jgi:hypothetical protein